jgi:uncharacterized protein (DUF305 family)
MKIPTIRTQAVGVLASVLIAGCASAGGGSMGPVAQGAPATTGGPVLEKPNGADVNFMAGMIPHHAQAVLIAGWAPSHGASPAVQRLCERIVVAQRDEIQLMQNWLRQKGQDVPAANSTRMHMTMNGMTHDMLMPGMLTDEELKALDASRGVDFDRGFLTAMIRHHQGAISMVDDLENAPGSRQDETVFRFSQDVYADQTTEIRVMTKMLEATK